MSPVQIPGATEPFQHQIIDAKSLETGEIKIVSTEVASISDSESQSDTSESSSEKLSSQRKVLPAAFQDIRSPNETEHVAVKVLKIIESYGLAYERDNSLWEGLTTCIPKVTKQIERGEPVRMLLPGFPFKSPNARDKVLGLLPDLGEELALAHLNGLCENILQVYDKGAEVHICSDGIVYNDLLGVSDETVWAYGEAVRQVAVDEEFKHIKFVRLWDLLEHPGEWIQSSYVTHASCIRRELQYRFGDAQFEADVAAKSSEDIRLTHESYLEFLAKDLAYDPAHQALSDAEKSTAITTIAKSMMGRWKAFASLLDQKRGDLVRLSIHDSTGSGKLSMSLIPQEKGALGFTPWHSSVSVELDGSYRTVHASSVRDTHTLVFKNGRPSFFRAKSELFDWRDANLHVTFQHLYPSGLIIQPVTSGESNPSPSIRQIPMQKVRHLSNNFSPIVLRGFSESTDEELFVEKGNELGNVLPWTFGVIAKVKDVGRTDGGANNVTSNEAMPMHFDGMFKYKDVEDPVTGEITKVLTPPAYQYFTCLATAPKGSGYTLFVNSRLFFRYLSSPWSAERLEPVTWGTFNTGYWAQKQEKLDLIVRHPVLNTPCLRWHQPWKTTKFSTCDVFIENEDESLIEVINELIYDWRTCLRFSWQTGDLLVNDNTAGLHTRTAYEANCDREMWRIHLD